MGLKSYFFFWRNTPQTARVSSFTRFLDHTQRRTTVGRLLSTSDQLVAETSIWQHTTLTTEIHASGGIRTHNLCRRAATDLRLRPRGHWNRLNLIIPPLNHRLSFKIHVRKFLHRRTERNICGISSLQQTGNPSPSLSVGAGHCFSRSKEAETWSWRKDGEIAPRLTTRGTVYLLPYLPSWCAKG